MEITMASGFADTLSLAPSANLEREIISIMKATIIALSLACLSTTLTAQWNDAFTQQLALSFFTYATATDAAAHSAVPDQEKRIAFLPVRVFGQGGDEAVSYVAIQTPLTWESADRTNVPASALPTTGGAGEHCDTSLSAYVTYEYTTYAAARMFYNALIWPIEKSHAYGPFATPRGTYLVVTPRLQLSCHS